MAIKITGAVLIIITSCIIGYLLSIKEDLRCRDLSEIEKILQNIKKLAWSISLLL